MALLDNRVDLEDPIHYLTWLIYPRGNGAAVALKNTLMDVIGYVRGRLKNLHLEC
ncbi:6108_t:CDS:2 [Acaulospora colombiana]|uniref:6108_t:CDS:1 n=1 Tax=Acaulospora colombiana TaxID=27376 RepID=A0ACA9LLN8_9GLOM|nr:6108_t:CDS:2 [Acaulospora colombiana]